MKKNKWVRESYKDSVSDLVPGQAMSASELWERFNRGQRLVINQRPINLYPADAEGNYIDKSVKDESLDNVLPDIEDRVDIEDYIDDIRHRREEIKLEQEHHRQNFTKRDASETLETQNVAQKS